MKDHMRGVGVNRLFHFPFSSRQIALVFLFPLLIMMHFASAATINPSAIKFDHSRTGFPLTGAHIQARCASCHVDGVFKGTPHDCASCHVGGNHMGAVFKNTTHIPTFDKCDKCHQTNAWTPVKKFDHLGVAPGSCQNCHNGTGGVTGKPMGHIATTASCDSCHKTTNWKQLGAGGLLPANHLPTNQACSLCHNQSSFIPGMMSHAGIISGCASCHNGQHFVGVTPVSIPATHIPTSMPCELCHSSTSTNAGGFLIPGAPNNSPTMMNHAGIVNNCALCHSGLITYAVGVKPKAKTDAPTTHMVTSSDCSACHTSTTTFLMANLTTPPIGHLPTTQVCSTCHLSNNFGPGSGVMIHTGIAGNCASCHNGQVFTGVTPKAKPVNHLPTNMPCESCHSPSNFTTFSGTLMSHTGIVNGCATCHNGQSFFGSSPVPKPSNHLPTNMPCETCHSTSNFTSFSGTLMSHTGIFSGCATCHGFNNVGIAFSGVTPKPQTISPTHTAAGNTPCESCHSSTTSFAIATGGTKPANHLPTTATCSLCHNGANYYPGIMNHTGIASGCATCHNGQVFAGVTPVSKPVNHLPTAAACETCHTAPVSTPPTAGGFVGGKMNHTGIVSGCTNCHNGQAFAGITPMAKPGTHLPTSMACETCHSTTKTSPGGFAGTLMNHTGIFNNCTQCHNGQVFAGVTPVSKSAKHIPYATTLIGGSGMQCEFCHSASVFTSFMTGTVSSTTMHNGTTGGGACYTCHHSPNQWSATNMQTKTHNGTSASKDCSSSGCHKPLGKTGSSYTNWGG